MKQYTLSPILDAYDTVLFDMDGVITSEQAYWDSAALAVYEMYFGSHYFGSDVLDANTLNKNLKQIRNEVFCGDSTIRLVKDKGVNSNWDLAYVVLGIALTASKNGDFKSVFDELTAVKGDTFTLYETISQRLSDKFCKSKEYFDRLGAFWQDITSCFQEWFLGDKLFCSLHQKEPRLTGKQGLLSAEEPIVDKEKLLKLLFLMQKSGKRIGIGTGRPKAECITPLEQWNAKDYFTADAVVTYDDVAAAQDELSEAGINIALPKPHPFMFLKGCFGNKVTANDIVSGNYDKKLCRRTLVIGDAGADLFSARNAGCDFAAVLTGVQGKAARSFFEKENANFIFNNVLELMTEKE